MSGARWLRGGTLSAWCFVAACASAPWPGPEPFDGPNDSVVAPEPVVFTPADDLLPSIDASGRWLAFASRQNGNLDVWVRDFRTRSSFPLTRAPADDFDPDLFGERLAWVSRRVDAKGDIFIRDDFGDDGRRLTGSETEDRQPRFSVDGRTLYFTSSLPGGRERVEALNLADRTRRVVSPGPGWDPAPVPDARHLVYTAPGNGPRSVPRLVALRLTDGATVAVTPGHVPAGFARFGPDDPGRMVFVRFPDDDDGNKVIERRDRASLWEARVDFDALFEGAPPPLPFPLTDGSENELFPAVGPAFVYFAEGRRGQDIARLPRRGRFPRTDDGRFYLELAETQQAARARWFTLRCALAVSADAPRIAAAAHLRIGRLHRDRGRPDLARIAFRRSAEAAVETTARGLAEVELLELAGVPRRELERLEETYQGAPRVAARLAIARARRLRDDGRTGQGLSLLARIPVEFPGDRRAAALAAFERIQWMESTGHPKDVARAYLRWMNRHPGQPDLLERAANRLVDQFVDDLTMIDDPARRSDALRQALALHPHPLVERVARVRLAERYEASGEIAAALSEFEVAERLARADPAFRARVTAEIARLREGQGDSEGALEAYRSLRRISAQVPAWASVARDGVVRTNLERARRAEEEGRFDDALAAYGEVVQSDETRIFALRRRAALTARVGRSKRLVRQEKAERDRTPDAPVAHYRLGLAQSYTDDLSGAERSLTRALELNPQLAAAHLTRGWVREVRALERPGFFRRMLRGISDGLNLAFGFGDTNRVGPEGWLEQAIEDYKAAARLNREAEDPQFEADALLNLGNAHHRLGISTYDVTNLELAFERYIEALRLGLEFRGGPRQALVFWERLGRAAAWARAWPESITATRRALSLVEAAGTPQRSAQLWGNLALAYDQAGSSDRAKAALRSFERALDPEQARSRLVVALRDQARARLEGEEGHSPSRVWESLRQLERAQIMLDVAGVDPGPAPTMWRPVTDNTSRALFGFDTRGERAVLLAFEQKARRRLGDVELAESVGAERIRLNREIERNIPNRALFFSREIMTLVALRERLGLQVEQVYAELSRGRTREALARLQAARDEAESWYQTSWRVSDRKAHAIDLAHLEALDVELRLALGVEPLEPDVEGRLDRAAGRIRWGDRPGRAPPQSLPERPLEVLTGTVAFTRAATTTEALPELAARARVRLAQGRWLGRGRPAREPGEVGRSFLTALDGSLGDFWRRQSALLRAIEMGRRGGSAGRRVAAVALAEVALDRVELGHASGSVLAEAARALAVDAGAFDVWMQLQLDTSTTAEAALAAADRVPPAFLGRALPSFAAELVRRARRAPRATALRALDRAASWTAFGRTLPVRVPPSEPTVAERLARLRDLRRLHRNEPSTPGLWAELRAEADRASGDDSTDWGALRLWGRPFEPERIEAALGPKDVLLWLVPTEGDGVELWRVETSTGGLSVARRRVAPPATPRSASGWARAALGPWASDLAGRRIHWVPTLVAGADRWLPNEATLVTSPSVWAWLSGLPPAGTGQAQLGWDSADAGAPDAAGWFPPGAPDTERIAVFAATSPLEVLELRGVGRGPLRVPERSRWGPPRPEDGTRDTADKPASEATVDGLSASADLLRSRWIRQRDLPGGLDLALGAQGIRAAELRLEGPDGRVVRVGPAVPTEGERSRALERALPSARSRALALVRSGRFREGAAALRRWLSLERKVGEDRYVRSVLGALAGLLAEQLEPPQPGAAAAVQAQLLAHLEASDAPALTVAEARVRLAFRLHQAGRIEASEAAYLEGLASLQAIGPPARKAWAAALLDHARALEDRLEFRRAAEQVEAAVAAYERAGVFGPDARPPPGAVDALLEAGALAMNRLSDPKRARAAYDRAARRLAGTDAALRVELGRVRLARRTGRPAAAARRAAQIRARARAADAPLLELEAVIEQANAAWALAEYADAEASCRESLDLAERFDTEVVQARAATRRRLRRQVDLRRVFAYSVCGLVALAQGRSRDALLRLQAGLRKAQALELPREVATQHNNLGRALLELGRTKEAVAAFRRALRIDADLKDVYGLAYDHRNLGRALTVLGSSEAEPTLRRALELSQEVGDRANAARTHFALGEWARQTAENLEAAATHYRRASKLARELELGELRWQSLWALGRSAEGAGDGAEARARYAESAQVLEEQEGRFTGRGRLGPEPAAPFHGLIRLHLADGNREAAWHTLLRVRALERGGRAFVATPLPWAQWAQQIPADGAVVVLRGLEDGLLVGVIRPERRSLQWVRAPSWRRDLAAYQNGMSVRGEVDPHLHALSKLVLDPILPALSGATKWAVVLDGRLRSLSISALPFGTFDPRQQPERVVDRAAVWRADSIAAALQSFQEFSPDPGGLRVFAAARSGQVLGAIPFAQKEAETIAEVFSGARIDVGTTPGQADRFLAALSDPGASWVHFAGHADLLGDRAWDPRDAALTLSDRVLTLDEMIGGTVAADLVVLSSCETGAGAGPAKGRNAFPIGGFVGALQRAGAGWVVATLLEVDDVVAAVFAKHLHRELRNHPLQLALHNARRTVRATWPHPAWWAATVAFAPPRSTEESGRDRAQDSSRNSSR
ncbi:MAG TPA: CHAT domain-containing protein [Myxococcales bacterium LLY-WYZ-16_1]|nr:CHAT domain-containing protein [Myxococcales bacterium LLY-WYZ-16_1]